MNTIDELMRDLEENHEDSTFATAQRQRLREELGRMKEQSDWTAFKEYLKNQIQDMDKLTPYILSDMYLSFQKEVLKAEFADKVKSEYEQYVAELKTRTPDDIIRSAYEIYNKDYIADFCSVNDIDLGSEDLKFFLETDNVLDEIYQEWDSMTQLNGVAEIDTAIEDVAYRLRMERAERQMEETKQAEERITPKPNRKMKL